MQVLNIVTGLVSAPNPKKDKDNTKLFIKLNRDAYAEIVSFLIQEVLAYVSASLPLTDNFNGIKLWQLFKAKFAGDELTAMTTALKKFMAIEYNSFLTFLPLVRAANQKITLLSLALDNQV
ncbi:hypothetical protein PTTG_08809, partial [Puccinia triticina 1-1 BBBD Race 1]